MCELYIIIPHSFLSTYPRYGGFIDFLIFLFKYIDSIYFILSYLLRGDLIFLFCCHLPLSLPQFYQPADFVNLFCQFDNSVYFTTTLSSPSISIQLICHLLLSFGSPSSCLFPIFDLGRLGGFSWYSLYPLSLLLLLL